MFFPHTGVPGAAAGAGEIRILRRRQTKKKGIPIERDKDVHHFFGLLTIQQNHRDFRFSKDWETGVGVYVVFAFLSCFFSPHRRKSN